ncbi:unnamed protein product [Effrenium voratum]|nr:unnamed protein product [Effrenium voratum]
MPPLTLKNAILTSEDANKDGHPVEKIRWLECFTDKENVSEFCEATDPAGNLESNSSPAYKEYQDRLRAIALRKEGHEKSEIAEALGRPRRFVETWWRKEPKEVPKPPGVHDYLKTEFWRDIEIIRGFGKGLGIYEDALNTTEWVQPMSDGREFKNGGGYRLKYDKEGRMRPQGNQNAKDGVIPGRLPKLDKLIQQVMVEQGINDRVLKRPGLLWYPDGTSDAIVHRHEAWTALMSFGSPRILTIDGHPVLLRDGDLIIFGTQRHGVPKMCQEGATFDDYGGRMSVVMFFMPTGKQAEGTAPWRAIHDAPSRKASAMLQEAHLGRAAQVNGMLTGAKSAEMRQLLELGFGEDEAAAALQATGDVELAAEALLNGAGQMLLGCGETGLPQSSVLLARLKEIQATGCGSMSMEWEEKAILEQLQDWTESASWRVFSELQEDTGLAMQFAQYEEMLDAEDAEEWDGRGDLMVRDWRRRHLHIEQQEPSITYSLGCGSLSERSFFELLSLHSIHVLYDFRASAELAAPHLKPSHLEGACKRHAIHYRFAPLGRDVAYGILKHLREDEGRNLLAELVWWARRKRTAFLGAEEDWRLDHRCAIAARLMEAGHSVKHLASDGSMTEHLEFQLPEFILGEEARLRTLEKQRQSGERPPAKSAASRSTEAVARYLAAPAKVIDAGAELRKANTQAELCRIQRRLADLQRRSADSDAKAGLGPKLLHVNKWVKAEAEQQRANLAAGKTKDGKDKDSPSGVPAAQIWAGTGGTSGGNPDFFASASAASSSGLEAQELTASCAAEPAPSEAPSGPAETTCRRWAKRRAKDAT